MSTGTTENAASGDVTSSGIERLPPKTPYAHDAILRIQRLDATLGGMGLLEVAKGLLPTEVYEITIIDLSDIPPPAATAAAKDHIAYRKTLAEQKANLKRRENLVITKRNKLYATLLEACKPHQKTIHDRLVKECDYGTELFDESLVRCSDTAQMVRSRTRLSSTSTRIRRAGLPPGKIVHAVPQGNARCMQPSRARFCGVHCGRQPARSGRGPR